MRRLTTLLLFLLLIPSSLLANDQNIVIASGEWPPWTGRELPHNGFINHIVKEAFAREGRTVRFEFYPWPRTNQLVKYGEVDASSYWYNNENRHEYVFFSDIVSIEDTVFFHLKGKNMPPWKELSDLKRHRIGVVNGITYEDELMELSKKGILQLYQSNTEKENFNKLIRNRVDIFPAPRRMGQSILETQFSPEERNVIDYSPQKLASYEGYIVFPMNKPNSEALRDAFNAGLRKIKEDGTYDKLMHDMDEGRYSAPTRQ